MIGKYSFYLEEKKKCCFELLDLFDYDEFDVELFYKLIKNFCFLLKLIRGWGEKLDVMDIKFGDDVECLIYIREEFLKYVNLFKFILNKFMYEEIWNEIEFVSKRIYIEMKVSFEYSCFWKYLY